MDYQKLASELHGLSTEQLAARLKVMTFALDAEIGQLKGNVGALMFALDQCLPYVEVLQKLVSGTKEAFAIEIARQALAKARGEEYESPVVGNIGATK